MREENSRKIFFDTETTGIGQGHRIIELGAVEAIERKLTGHDFHRIINPQREIDEVAMNIHGITQEIVQDKPLFADIVDDFLDYIRGAEVIIHNATFDVKMVDYELQLLSERQSKKYGQLSDYCHIVDSLAVARKVVKSGKHSLDALCDRYRIDRSQRTKHSAVLDCSLLFHVYIGLTSGQGELFAEGQRMQGSAKSNQPRRDYRQIKLPSVVVSKQEIKLHQAFMKKFKLEG